MMAALKNLLAELLTPFSVAMILMAVGLALLWFTRKQRTGKALVTAGVAMLLVFGNWVLSRAATGALENRHPAFMRTSLAHPGATNLCVVVLGTGYDPDPSRPANSQAYGAFLARFVEAARLRRLFPEARLLVSVSGDAERAEKSRFLLELCATVGLQGPEPVIMGGARSTFGEAVATRDFAGNGPVLLVTSAVHMRRAAAIFEAAGIRVVPAPTDYLSTGGGCRAVDLLSPCPKALQNWSRLCHELTGTAYAGMRGRL